MDGENRIVTGWIGVIAGAIFLIIISSTPGDEDAIPGCCCFLILFCLLLQSGYEQKKKAQNQVVYIPQPIQQQVIHHTHTYAPPQVIQQPVPRPKPRPLGASPVRNTPKKKLGASKEKYPDTEIIGGGGIRTIDTLEYYNECGADHFSISTIILNPFRFTLLYINYILRN